jgi:acyl-CoA thioester hydrolase
MDEYKFKLPIQLRYSDLDPQWHVNNVRTLSFLEHARFAYLMELGLFDGKSFFDLGLIVADVHLAYLAPIELDQKISACVRVSKIGNKSLVFEYQIFEETTQEKLVHAETVMVAYDYHTHQSIPVLDQWREKICAYEGIRFPKK